MRISEASRRSGVPATALRYYEIRGLIAARRSGNGYREYDVLQTRSCTEVRDSLRPLLAEQLRRIDEKLARLERLSRRLRTADAGLASCPDRDERCSSECALRPPDGATA